MNEWLRSFQRGGRIELIGNMNGRVNSNEIAGVVGRWGVDGVNENGEHLVDICAERGLFLANTFQHKLIHKYMWRDEKGEQKIMIDYIAMDEKLKKDVLDARVVRGMFGGSDHYAAVARIPIRGEREYGKKCKTKGRQAIANESYINATTCDSVPVTHL